MAEKDNERNIFETANIIKGATENGRTLEYGNFYEHEEFYKRWHGKYSRYWVERFGLIPELPTSFDNANSIYELLAWLQRAFKALLDDFLSLEAEVQDFKEAFADMIEDLLPALIRRFFNSKEFDDLLNKKMDEYFNRVIKPYIDQKIQELKDYVNGELDKMRDFVRSEIEKLKSEVERRLKDLEDKVNAKLNEFNNRLRDVENRIGELEGKVNANTRTLEKIINNLRNSGAWNGGLDGDFNPNRNIATGNINLFGGTQDGESFIRTNNGQSENDVTVGVS